VVDDNGQYGQGAHAVDIRPIKSLGKHATEEISGDHEHTFTKGIGIVSAGFHFGRLAHATPGKCVLEAGRIADSEGMTAGPQKASWLIDLLW
jgi:hypothetical protein